MTDAKTPQDDRPLSLLELEIESGMLGVRLLRGSVRSFLTDHGFPPADVESILLGLDEVLMNACEHAQCDGQARVDFRLALYRDRLELEVGDRGNGVFVPQAARAELPDEEAESGRGLFLIHHTMDEVQFEAREGGGTLVRLVKRR